MKDFSINVRVYYEDTDAAGVVYHANYLRFIERARTDWLRNLGVDQGWMKDTFGLAFAVRSIEADYLRPARLDDDLRVQASIKSIGGAQLMFEQEIARGDEVLFTAKVRVACFDPVAARPAAIPTEIVQKLNGIME